MTYCTLARDHMCVCVWCGIVFRKNSIEMPAKDCAGALVEFLAWRNALRVRRRASVLAGRNDDDGLEFLAVVWNLASTGDTLVEKGLRCEIPFGSSLYMVDDKLAIRWSENVGARSWTLSHLVGNYLLDHSGEHSEEHYFFAEDVWCRRNLPKALIVIKC